MICNQYNSKNQENQQDKCHGFSIQKKIEFVVLDSTNDWAKKNMGDWAESGVTLISTELQTAGRGRRDNTWHSSKNDICASFCFWLDDDWKDLGHIPQVMALAVLSVLENFDLVLEIKWPNDLMCHGKKLGGLLGETKNHGNKKGFICGLGLNLHMNQNELDLVGQPATSIDIESGVMPSKELLLEQISAKFCEMMREFFLYGFGAFYETFASKLNVKKGSPISFHDQGLVVKGIFEDYTAEGGVVMQFEDGVLRTISAGKVIV